MLDKCCVPKCTSSMPAVDFHVFPRSEKRFRRWLKSINDPALVQLNKKQVISRRRVCHKHFERKFIRQTPAKGIRFRLTPDAYPTLFSKQEIESGIPNRTETGSSINRVFLQDHTYHLDSDLDISKSLGVHTEEHDSSVSDRAVLVKSRDQFDIYSNLPESISRPSTSSQAETLTHAAVVSVEASKKPDRHTRVTENILTMTPKCKNIYSRCVKLMNSRSQINFQKRLQLAQKYEKSESFQKLTAGLSTTSKSFFWMQIKLCSKKAKGRRFTKQEKVMALSLLKKSPKGYKLLQKMFILPSRRSLNKLVNSMDIESGVNITIFNVLKEQVKDWPEIKRYCSIIFDEVALEPHLNYSSHNDQITGFTQLEGDSTPKLADHALVFMLRGACEKWRQPISFYFCEGTTPAIILKDIINKIVFAVKETGLIPIALICDQGPTNRTAIKGLQEVTKSLHILKGVEYDNSIEISDSKMYVLFDPPHLIKCIRNNFLSKNVLFNGGVAKWEDIVEVYKMDCELGEIRLLPQLTDEHILPEKIKKMKVSNCTKVLSERMAAMLKYTSQFAQHISTKAISNTMGTTAEAVHFFDQLFDSCNGGSYNRGKPLRCAVKEGSAHHEFWREALKTLSSIKFLKDGKSYSVPSLVNWRTTIRSFQKIWIMLNGKGISRFYARNFNQDPIENFFGRIRAHNYRNINPSCSTFIHSFKSLFLSDIISDNSENVNCEEDDTIPLNLNCFFNKQSTVDSGTEIKDFFRDIRKQKEVRLRDTNLSKSNTIKESIRTNAKSFTAGYVTRRILKKNVKCKTCTDDLITKDITNVHNWITHRERKVFKSRRLTYPTPIIIRHFGYIIEICNIFLNEQAFEKDLSKKIASVYKSKYNFDWFRCQLHKEKILNDFLNLTIKIQIHNWTTGINRILKGVDIHRLSNDLPYMQTMALEKFKKRYKRNIKK